MEVITFIFVIGLIIWYGYLHRKVSTLEEKLDQYTRGLRDR